MWIDLESDIAEEFSRLEGVPETGPHFWSQMYVQDRWCPEKRAEGRRKQYATMSKGERAARRGDFRPTREVARVHDRNYYQRNREVILERRRMRRAA